MISPKYCVHEASDKRCEEKRQRLLQSTYSIFFYQMSFHRTDSTLYMLSRNLCFQCVREQIVKIMLDSKVSRMMMLI